MTDAERPYLAKILAVFSSVFNEPVDELKAEGYFAALKDLPLEAVRAAAHSAIRADKFFPRPARLRELVTGNDGDSAELAWMGLLREVRRTGWTGTPELPEATLETLRGVWGSWENLCQTLPNEGPELLGWAKRFGAAYVATTHRRERPELIGRDEAKSLLEGLTKKTSRTEQLPAADSREVSTLQEGAEAGREPTHAGRRNA